METGDLTDRIAARVREKLEEMGITVTDSEIRKCMCGSNDAAGCSSCCGNESCHRADASESRRKILLILTEDHGTDCHALLENSELAGAYEVQCALLSDYKIDMDRVDTVVLFNLTCANLSKLCSGMADTPYLKTALQAIMSGKRLLASPDEIEYLQYEKSMPAPMWKKMSGELDFLKSCGLSVVSNDKLVCTAMNRTAAKPVCTGMDHTAQNPVCTASDRPAEKTASGELLSADACRGVENEVSISRKVVAERDVMESWRAGATCIRVKKGCIITDLARETAARKGIRFCCD